MIGPNKRTREPHQKSNHEKLSKKKKASDKGRNQVGWGNMELKIYDVSLVLKKNDILGYRHRKK